MSQAGPSLDSRPSQTKSQIGPRPEVSDSADSLPTVEDRINELYELYPDKAENFLVHYSAEDPREAYDPERGIRIREELVEETDGGDRYSVTLGATVRRYLEWIDERRDVWGRFKHADGDTFEKRFLHSFDPEYLKTDYATLKGLEREIESLKTPSVALVTLTSSGTYENGAPRGPVDHQHERRAAWDPTRKALRYTMEKYREAGRIGEWGYVVVEEHHPGKGFGKNAGLGHDHLIVWFDGDLDAEHFRPVISTWIDECPGASRDGHNLDHPDPEKRPVDVRTVDPDRPPSASNVNSAAGYIVKYLYPEEGDADPLERPIERLMYESVKWATNTRRLRKSDNSNRAIKADLCRQKAARVDGRPDHGKRLGHRREGRGPELVCAECGSAWDIDEADAETIVEARLRPEEPDEPERGGAWGAGSAGARTSPDGGIESYEIDDEPTTGWKLEAVVVDGEEHEPGRGGVAMRTVRGINHLWENTDSLKDDLAYRRERDRAGTRPATPELPEPGGWSAVEEPSQQRGSTYGVLHEPTQAERRKIVRTALRELEGVAGAPEREVVELVVEQGVSPEKAEYQLEKFLERGVAYMVDGQRIRLS